MLAKTLSYLSLGSYLVLLVLAGCATPPPAPVVTAEEKARADISLGHRFAEELQARFKMRTDVEVNVYLRGLAQKLADSTPDLRKSPVGVFVIEDRDAIWKNYALPGNRLYLSLGLIKKLEFENELAAVMAIEFAHVLNRDALNRIEMIAQQGVQPVSELSPNNVPFFGPGGLFAFSDESRVAAAEQAVDILYAAGVDPRGVVSLLADYRANPKVSPYDPALIRRLTEAARQAIAELAPLRNPLVKSDAFLSIQKRIKRL